MTINDWKVLHPKYRIFKDAADEFRFHLKASNGEIIATSEAYKTKDGAVNGINVVKRSGDAEIDDLAVIGTKVEKNVGSSQIKRRVKSAKAKMARTEVAVPEIEVPPVEFPEEVA